MEKIKIGSLKFHVLFDDSPPPSKADYASMLESIRDPKIGILDDIWITGDNGIVNGGTRLKIAAELGWTEEQILPKLKTVSDSLEVLRRKALESNLNRRHLSTAQRAQMGAKLATLRHGQRNSPIPKRDPQLCGSENGIGENEDAETQTQADAADTAGVSERSIQQARVIEEQAIPSVKRAVRIGELPLSPAEKIARLPMEKQEAAYETYKETGKVPGAKKKKKKRADPQPDPKYAGIPKSVANALEDTWHADCARLLSRMAKECKGAFSWSSWLDASVLDHLKMAEECFLTAIPKKVCGECKGQKKVDGEACKKCRGGGYLASQV